MEKIKKYIDEFILIKAGDFTSTPIEELLISPNVRMKKLGLKHIVESRLTDGYGALSIKEMIQRVPEVLYQAEIDIPNTNPKYAGSRMCGKLYSNEGRALLILYQKIGKIKIVYNAYYRSEVKYKKILK